MTARATHAKAIIDRLHTAAAELKSPVTFMEVCGTHTVSAFRSGLHSLTPPNVKLLSGPGCPVCVTSQGDIDLMLSVAALPRVTLCTYGDMLRVPGAGGTLEQARGRGAQVRIVYSTMDAVKLAAQEPQRQVVMAAIGFETTTPPTAIAILEARRQGLKNFSVVVSHKQVMPAIRALLDGGKVNLNGFMCPGHVSVVIGSEAYRPVPEKYGLSCVICGFEDIQIAEGLARLVELVRDGPPELVNLYPQAVTPQGNKAAQAVIAQVFEPADVVWRGVGCIPQSGLKLRAEFESFDAQKRFSLSAPDSPEPAGCRCGEVITGLCTPADCKLFGTQCTPIHPIGPCMVSSEGTCQAWFKYNRVQSSKFRVQRKREVVA